MRTKPSTDIATITNSSIGTRSEINLWSMWIEDYSKKHWAHKLKSTPVDQGLHTRISSGPNGGASVIARVYDILVFTPLDLWPLFIRACKTFNRRDLLTLAFQSLAINARNCKNKRIEGFLRKKDPKHAATL